MMTRLAFIAIAVLAAPLQGGEARSAALAEARGRAESLLTAFSERMRESGRMDETEDARRIHEFLSGKSLRLVPGRQGFPGEGPYAEILEAWSRLGRELSQCFKGVSEGEVLAGWFSSFPIYSDAGLHLNRRRAAIGLGPVTLDFSATYGMFAHARYQALNRDNPHPTGSEFQNAPGSTPEGLAAARTSRSSSRGSAPAAIDEWLGSYDAILFSPKVGRVALGGSSSWWARESMGGKGVPPTRKVLSFPANGDEDIPVAFEWSVTAGMPGIGPMARYEAPFKGTPCVVWFPGASPGKVSCRLLDEDGNEVPIQRVASVNPLRFGAVSPLAPGRRYRIEVGPQGSLYACTFTTQRERGRK